MNMLRIALPSLVPALGLALAVGAGRAVAQDAATTLLAAARAADVVVRAQVSATSEPAPDWLRVQFTSSLVLKGDAPATFAVLEPAGACCGRSLFLLRPGDERLLFLRRTGSTWHAFGGARGVVSADAATIAHVQQLLLGGSDREIAHVLAQQLANDDARIADDAALALATLSELASASAEDLERITTALQLSLAQRTTRWAALAEAAMRSHEAAATAAVVTSYLDTPRGDQAKLLRSVLSRHPTTALAEQLAPQLTEPRAVRAAELFAALPESAAQELLAQVLPRTRQPRVQLCLAETLLARGGDAETLTASFPAVVVELAKRRQRQAPRFRNIDPGVR